LPDTGIDPSGRGAAGVYPGGMPTRSLLDTRTAAELSADAAHFETWAERVRDNAGLSAAFRRLSER